MMKSNFLKGFVLFILTLFILHVTGAFKSKKEIKI